MSPWVLFLVLTLLCVFLEAFFSMFEMASVSFNKVRLQYYITKNKKRAKWLAFLLERPSRLFGTTLICVNTVLQLGSECSRRFYEAIGASPDFAPLTQVFIVMIFGELAPLFAARRHSEAVAMRSVPIVYMMYWILAPFIKAMELLTTLISKKEKDRFLSRDELKKAFVNPKKDLNEPIENIFTVKTVKVDQVMLPLKEVLSINSSSNLHELSHLLTVNYTSFVLVFHRSERNVVGVIKSRSLLQEDKSKRVIDIASPPWFITEDVYILDVLKQFRTNNQTMAVVLSSSGEAKGVVSIDQIITYLFGQETGEVKDQLETVVEKTLPGDMKISEFNEKFNANLSHPEADTLSELLYEKLKHHPVKGEVIVIDQFEIEVLEPGIIGAKTLLVRTVSS